MELKAGEACSSGQRRKPLGSFPLDMEAYTKPVHVAMDPSGRELADQDYDAMCYSDV